MPFLIGLALNFISNPIAKAIIALVVSSVGATLVGAFVMYWRASIRAEDLAEYNAKQLQVNLQQAQDQIKQAEKLADDQRMAIDAINAARQQIIDSLSGLETNLEKPDTTKNAKPASDVLKQTIKQLSGAR